MVLYGIIQNNAFLTALQQRLPIPRHTWLQVINKNKKKTFKTPS